MRLKLSRRRSKIALKKKLAQLAQQSVGTPNLILYRVIGKNGYGYRHHAYPSLDSLINSVIVIDYTNYYKRRPLPIHSGIDINLLGEEWLFAFTSLEDLNTWFSYRERRAGSRLGGLIQILKADSRFVIKGVKQAVFHSKAAFEVKRVKLNHFDMT